MKKYYVKEPNDLILRDYLAADRTKLAIERTFLAYVRTALGLFSAGIACIKFINDIEIIYNIGILMLVVSPIVLIVGIVSCFITNSKIKTIPDNELIKNKQ